MLMLTFHAMMIISKADWFLTQRKLLLIRSWILSNQNQLLKEEAEADQNVMIAHLHKKRQAWRVLLNHWLKRSSEFYVATVGDEPNWQFL